MTLTLVIGNRNYSSWSLRAWLALQRTGVDFEEVRIPLAGGNTPEIKKYSPSGRVPVLIDGNLTLWDSLAICEYLAEGYPEAQLWPEARQARGVARSISAEMHAGFALLRHHLPMDCRSRYPGRPVAAGLQAEIDRVQAIWRECRAGFGKNGDFLFGPFSIADAMFAPVVTRFLTYDIPMDASCQDYATAVLGLGDMQAWLTAAAAETESIRL